MVSVFLYNKGYLILFLTDTTVYLPQKFFFLSIKSSVNLECYSHQKRTLSYFSGRTYVPISRQIYYAPMASVHLNFHCPVFDVMLIT